MNPSALSAAGAPRARPPRSTRDLVAVLVRQAGLIALFALLGAAVSLLLFTRPPRVHVATAKRVRVAGTAAMRRIDDARAADDGGLRLDLNPDVATASVGSPGPSWNAESLALHLRLDQARPLGRDDAEDAREPHLPWVAWRPRGAHSPSGDMPPEPEPGRLESARTLDLRADLRETGSRVVGDAPDDSGTGPDRRIAAWLGPMAGLLAGLLLAALRELGGDRLRSSREAEWALGVPVLGAIPTLSARARDACLASPMRGPLNAAATEPA